MVSEERRDSCGSRPSVGFENDSLWVEFSRGFVWEGFKRSWWVGCGKGSGIGVGWSTVGCDLIGKECGEW